MTHNSLVETFNTHNLADAKVQALMTARERERDAVMAAVRANLAPDRGRVQHVAVYGPRGFGKSFLARVIELDVAAEVASGAAVAYVLLPEEQHNLARSPDGLLRYFEARLRAEQGAWEAAAFTWPAGNAFERWRSAGAKLEATMDARFGPGRGLVIAVVENFDLLIRDVFAEDGAEERLRKWMTHPDNRVMLFVTATGHVDMNYERPLFQAFKSVTLSAWGEDDCIAYFNRRRAFVGAQPLDEATEAKARAIANFIGGNPRLAQLLSDVLENDDALGVAELLNALADELADYYRRRIDDLPPLSRGLLDALIRGGEPCSATSLAKRVGTDQKTIARAFAVLTQTDVVSGRQASDSKEKLFSVRDRVFVHFYRVRYGNVPREASPLVHIVEFLEMIYRTPEEKRAQATKYLERGRYREARLFLDLAGAPEGFRGQDDFRFRLASYERVFPGALPRSAKETSRLLDERPEDLFAEARDTAEQSDGAETRVFCRVVQARAAHAVGLGEARAILETARTEAQGRQDLALAVDIELGIHLSRTLSERDVATQICLAFPQDIAHPLLRAAALNGRAWALGNAGQHDEAIAATVRAADLAEGAGDPYQQARALRHRAFSLSLSGRHEEAIAASTQASALAAAIGARVDQVVALYHLARSLRELGRNAEAILALEQAKEIARAVCNVEQQVLVARAASLTLGRLGRREEAITEAREAVRLARELGDRTLLEWTLADCLSSAAGSGDADAVAMKRELILSSRIEAARRRPTPGVWLGVLLQAVTRSRDWAGLVGLAKEETDWFAKELSQQGSKVLLAVAAVVVDIDRERGSHGAFEATVEVLDALLELASVMAGRADEAPTSEQMAAWFIRGLAAEHDGPQFLRDVAELLREREGAARADDVALLLDLATFHEAGRVEASLERVDPDRAALIRRLWKSGPKRNK